MAADGELLDIVLTERLPIYQVREALSPVIPDGWRLVDLQDVWLAGPALAGRVAAADYRITLAGGVAAALDSIARARRCLPRTTCRASGPRGVGRSPTTSDRWSSMSRSRIRGHRS